jgi:Tol biopolymer transport system component
MTNVSVQKKLFKRVSIPVLVCCIALLGVIAVLRIWRYFPINPGVDFLSHPAWSPDGKLIAFECTFLSKADIDYRAPDSYQHLQQARQDICLSNVDGSNFQRITNSRFMYYPSWSPSGNFLAWMNNYDNIIVWDYRTAQSKQYHSNRPLYGSSFDNWDYLDWSVDENTLFLQGSGVALNIQTGEFFYPPEPENKVAVCCNTWSSDGKYFAAIENHTGTIENYTLRVYQQQKLVFESVQAAVLGRLSWSQDNTTLAWVGLPLNWASDPKHINDGYSLFLTYVPTSETVSVPVLFDGAAIIWSPTWVRDNKKVAFASWDKIYWLDIKRSYSPFSIIVQKDGSINAKDIFSADPLTWSPDEQLVAYITSERSIKIETIHGNITTPIITDQINRLTPLELFQVLVMLFGR